MIDYNVPFYSNTSDDTHCFQAALKMVLKYFKPEEEYSWEKLDTITNKKENMWTWPMAGLLWMHQQGFDVKDIEPFDYETFISQKEKYLLEEFGQEVGQASIDHTDINQELHFAKELLQSNLYERRVPKREEIVTLLKEKYIIICSVNSNKLNGKEGYIGHMVVVKGYTDKGFVLHDPGLPPQENRSVFFDEFEAAWAYPSEKAKNIMAFTVK